MSKFKLPQLPRPRKKLDARVRAGNASMADEYDDDEPQTKLSSAFVVVLLLHVVAVGGIYAFNSIKASRRTGDAAPTGTAAAMPKTSSPAKEASAATDEAVATALPSMGAPAAAIAPVSKQRVYHVKQGDTLTSIARQFAVNVTDLGNVNGLKATATLRIGQSLNIPAKGASTAFAETSKPEGRAATTGESKSSAQSYTVKSGDRVLFIAKRFNVSPDALIALNKIKDPSKLQVGQTLKIPAKKGN